MKDIYAYIDAHAAEFVADLQTFVQQPSISAQDIGLRECAALIRDMMHRDGLPAAFHELEVVHQLSMVRSGLNPVKRCCAIRTMTSSRQNQSRHGLMVARGLEWWLMACFMDEGRQIINQVS